MSAANRLGKLTLASRFVAALAEIAADRVAELAGRTLPRTTEQLAEPQVLRELLAGSSHDGARALPQLRNASLSGVEFESSNCTNFLIDVEFDDAPKATAGFEQPLPRTLYVKLPCHELGTRAFANAVGFWQTEVTFCRRIAAQVPVRVPRVYAAEQRGSRFVLLLENLQELEGAKLFVNRDMAAGTTPERARMCLETFAELHAAYWGWSCAQREELLPLRLHPYLRPGGRGMTQALNAAAIDPAHRAAPEIFTKYHAEICQLAIQKWDLLMQVWFGEPLTLIHGDSHLANCFEYPTPQGPRMGLIDFQGVQWCHAMRDVQYHLINSLEPEVLAEHESSLIDHYVEALGRQGVELSADLARSQYRAFSFQTLMVAVISIGLGSLTERDDTVRTVLRRSVAAIDRLDFGGWLARL